MSVASTSKAPVGDRRQQRPFSSVRRQAPVRHPAPQDVTHVPAQLAVGPGDEDPYRPAAPRDVHVGGAHRGGAPAAGPLQSPSTTGARSRRGSHQVRWSAYHPTVSASPFSNGTVGSQPSSRRIFDESRR